MLLTACFHSNDSSDLDFPLHTSVNGYKNIMGSGKHVSATYLEGDGAAGNDNIYFSEDDRIEAYGASELKENGDWISFSVETPGDDAKWFTDDDTISSYQRAENIDQGTFRETLFTSEGSDGKWFTADDTVQNYSVKTITLDENGGKQEKTIYYFSAGLDEVWFTDDDLVGNYHVLHFDKTERLTGILQNFQAGEDNILNTEDDLVGDYSYHQEVLEQDSESNSESILRTYYGQDGIYNTEDDVINLTIRESMTVSISAFDYESTYGFEKLYAYYSNAGDDGNWLTNDDVLSSAITTEVIDQGPSGFSSRRTSWSSGDNGLLGDADDEILHYASHSVVVDETSVTDKTHSYSSPGKDGIWLTADDVISDAYVYVNLWSTYPD